MGTRCASDQDCLTWNDGDGQSPSRQELDPKSGLCASCLLERARVAIDSCSPEDEARDDRALTVLSKVLRRYGMVEAFEAQLRRENLEAQKLNQIEKVLAFVRAAS